jgi:hypothetical protein
MRYLYISFCVRVFRVVEPLYENNGSFFFHPAHSFPFFGIPIRLTGIVLIPGDTSQ